MKEYKVIVGSAGGVIGGKKQRKKFEVEVSEAINNGWKLHGGVGSGTGAAANIHMLAQALVREVGGSDVLPQDL